MFDKLYDVINNAIAAVFAWFKDQFNTLFDFLLDVVKDVWGFFVGIIETLWTWQLDAWISLYFWAKDFAVDLWDWMWPRATEYALAFKDWIEGQLEAQGIDWKFEDLAEKLDGLTGLYADAAWLLPLNAVMVTVVSTFAVVAVLRFARWVLSFLWWTG